jgi:antitoxin component YwqK of YwqJK toxin-antitoxin module
MAKIGILSAASVILTAGLSFSCRRLTEPPIPAAVPPQAIRSGQGFWEHRSDGGEYIQYYPDGAVAKRGVIVNGLREGEWRSYSMNGIGITSIGRYHADWRDGLWEFFDTEGRLYYRIHYAEHPKREFISLITHDYGNENGNFERFFPDGRLEERGVFRGGYYDGPLVRYYRNGNIAVRGAYKKDKMEGPWIYYYPEGGIEREESYRNGTPDGVHRNFFPDGSLYQETHYKNGVESGPRKMYSDAEGRHL